jgi:DNA transformation protein and related proteins
VVKNIGAQTTRWLESIEIKTFEDIERLGVTQVYQRLKLAYPERVSLNALWALQSTVLGVPWNQLPESMKEELKQQLQKEGE